MIDAIITFSIRHRAAGHRRQPGPGRAGRMGRLGNAGRRDPRPLGKPGDRLHRVEGARPARDRGPGDLPAHARPARAARRAGGAVIERRRLLDDQRDLRRRRRPRRRTPARGRAAGSRAGRSFPTGADARAGARRRRRPARSSGTPSRAAGSTWAGSARSRTGTSAPSSARSRAWPRSRASAGFPIEYQVVPDPDRLRVFGVIAQGRRRGRRRRRTPRRAATSSTRGTPSTWCGASAGWAHRRRPATSRSTPIAPCATWRTWSCRSPGGGTIRLAEVADVATRPRLPPRRPGERRQRGHRRRGPDGPRREPARGHAPHQGQDPRAPDRPAARRSDRPVLRPHAADRGGDRHGHQYRRRGDDLGVVVRARGPASRADVARSSPARSPWPRCRRS